MLDSNHTQGSSKHGYNRKIQARNKQSKCRNDSTKTGAQYQNEEAAWRASRCQATLPVGPFVLT